LFTPPTQPACALPSSGNSLSRFSLNFSGIYDSLSLNPFCCSRIIYNAATCFCLVRVYGPEFCPVIMRSIWNFFFPKRVRYTKPFKVESHCPLSLTPCRSSIFFRVKRLNASVCNRPLRRALCMQIVAFCFSFLTY